MRQRFFLDTKSPKRSLALMMLMTALSAQAAPSVTAIDSSTDPEAVATAEDAQTTAPASQKRVVTDMSDTLAAQLQPSNKALSEANQELLSRNAQLQRQVNDLQTQANVLVYESKGQLFLYGAFTVLISLLVGIFVSWLVFVRRERW